MLQESKVLFDQDGFATMRQFLSWDERELILQYTRRFITKVVPTIDAQHVFYEDKNKPETMLRVENLQNQDPYFRGLLETGGFRELAELMLEGSVQPKSIGIFGKAPRIGKLTPPHQDAFYWKINPAKALTIWLAIDRSDEGNGCVRYLPKTHKEGMRPHEQSGVFGFSQHILDYGPKDAQREIPVCVDPGELIAHHCMVIHRADPNESDRLRRALGLVYYSQQAVVDDSFQKTGSDIKEKWAKEGKL